MSNSDKTIFDNPITEDGIKYYLFPANYPLFKAHKSTSRPIFEQIRPSFFGLKNTDPEYISSYEEEYGVIFEFKTTKPYKLVALDDKQTQTKIYTEAPKNIQRIFERNYGYRTNKRDSSGDSDRELSNYLCDLGYEGYATNNMPTDLGIFHIELLLCNAAEGIEYVGQVTTSKTKINRIMEKAQLERLEKERKERLEEKKQRARSRFTSEYTGYTPDSTAKKLDTTYENTPINTSLFGDSPVKSNVYGTPPKTSKRLAFDSPMSSPNKQLAFDSPLPKQNTKGKMLFDDDDDENVFGGKRKTIKKRQTNKKRKTNKKKKTNKKRKTIKNRKTNKK